MKIHIRNGHLVDPANGIDAPLDLFIAAGKVAAIGQAPDGFHANKVIDASDCVVCPGLVDLSARLREPGFEYKATLESELDAAVSGGVTSLCCPPDTDPVLDEPGLVQMLKYRARMLSRAHVYPMGALTACLEGKRLTEMAELHDAGCVAFSQATRPVVDTKVLRCALQYAATFGFAVWLYPLDPFLAAGGVAHDGEVATRLGLAGIPISAETVRLATVLNLARDTGVRMHITRITSAQGLAFMDQARAAGLNVTCDVSINHLHLRDADIGFFNPHCHLLPPLRDEASRDALRQALKDGRVQAVCSDHTPVDDDAKQLPFAEAEPGASGVELLLPMTLKWADETGVPLNVALSRITRDAAGILGIDAGTVGVGKPADVCVFDPQARWHITPAALRSQGKNTPFLGLEVAGKVRHTVVSGQVVFDAAAH